MTAAVQGVGVMTEAPRWNDDKAEGGAIEATVLAVVYILVKFAEQVDVLWAIKRKVAAYLAKNFQTKIPLL